MLCSLFLIETINHVRDLYVSKKYREFFVFFFIVFHITLTKK